MRKTLTERFQILWNSIFSRQVVFFTFLAMLNAFLAFIPVNGVIALVVGILGFGALGWAYQKNQPPALPEETPLFSREFFTPANWLLVLTFGFALLLRLYKLASYLSFPLPDEITNAYSAIHLNDHWTWRLFYHFSELPALYLWLLAIAYKFLGVSFSVLWLVPAILSFLSAAIYYLAFRAFFSKSFSFICLLILGFSFWPVFIGRFSHNAVLMVFCQSLIFWMLAKFVRTEPSSHHPGLSILLGFFLGLGFYTYFAWPLVALCVITTIGFFIRHSWPSRKWDLVVILVAAFFTALPLVITGLVENFGSYIGLLFVFNKNGDQTFQWDYRQNSFLFTNFFWTGLPRVFSYNSGWGGLLNPVLGSFFSWVPRNGGVFASIQWQNGWPEALPCFFCPASWPMTPMVIT